MDKLHEAIIESAEAKGYRIQPYKLNILMKTASKIINMIVSIPDFTVSLRDTEIILDIAMSAIKKAQEGVENER